MVAVLAAGYGLGPAPVKPSITIDERGVLLHVTDADGHGIAIPLEPTTVLELAGSLQLAAQKLKTPEGQRVAVRALGELFSKLVGGDDGPKKG